MDGAAPHCVRLKLPETVDIGVLEPLYDQIHAYEGAPLRIDASQVERIGTLGLQLLISARKTWEGAGIAFRIDEPSTAFLDAARSAGAAPILVPEFDA